MKKLLFTLFLIFGVSTSFAQVFFGTKEAIPDSVFNSLAQTPPMGWNSWNKFGCNDYFGNEGCRLRIYRSR